MIPEDMHLVHGLPRTHADISAEGGLSDVFPFIAVAVPLDEGLRKWRPLRGIDHMPGTHDALTRALALKMAGEWPLRQRQSALLSSLCNAALIHAGCVGIHP